MNYYAFHVGDYVVHTRHLDLMEDLAFRRMLDLYYTREKPLPDEVEQIGRLIGMRDHLAVIRDVLNEFFKASAEGWRNERCDAEIARMLDKQAKAKASAQASVNARAANAQRPPKKRSATKTKTNTTPKDSPEAPKGAFVRFWESYPTHPRKVARDKCEVKWNAAELDLIADKVLAGLEAWKASEQWASPDYIPAPHRWLNERRWEAIEALSTPENVAQQWHETGGGVKAKGAELGVPYTDDDDLFPFARYKARVMAAAGVNVREQAA